MKKILQLLRCLFVVTTIQYENNRYNWVKNFFCEAASRRSHSFPGMTENLFPGAGPHLISGTQCKGIKSCPFKILKGVRIFRWYAIARIPSRPMPKDDVPPRCFAGCANRASDHESLLEPPIPDLPERSWPAGSVSFARNSPIRTTPSTPSRIGSLTPPKFPPCLPRNRFLNPLCGNH